MLYPLTFHPIFKERVWGGRKLEQLYGKALPPGVPIGESWEITDRPEGESVIINGPLAGKTLRWVMERHPDELLGKARAAHGRFPLLVKILDAREKLSLQVHPPTATAAQPGGEPKTELWYVADAEPDAEIFAGLRRGVTRAGFERKIRDGTVADCFHRHHVRKGDAMFLPSGRVHALGGGNVIFEIQQNSDTTYRVFDWNRTGLDGKPRELHVPQALASIAFEDFEPALIQPQRGQLVEHELFEVQLRQAPAGSLCGMGVKDWRGPLVVGLVEGAIELRAEPHRLRLWPGQFCLVPACLPQIEFAARQESLFLIARPH